MAKFNERGICFDYAEQDFDIEKLPEKKKAIPSKWVFNTKVNDASEVVRYGLVL